MRKVAAILIPPVVTTALVILFLLYMLWDEAYSPPRIIDGEADDDPERAAAFLLIGSPFLFGVLLVVQLIALKVSHGQPRRLPAAYAAVVLGVAAVVATPHLLSVTGELVEAFAFFIGAGVALLLPMGLVSWGLLRWIRPRPVQTGAR